MSADTQICPVSASGNLWVLSLAERPTSGPLSFDNLLAGIAEKIVGGAGSRRPCRRGRSSGGSIEARSEVRTVATATSTLLVDAGPRGGLMAFARCGRDLVGPARCASGLVPAGTSSRAWRPPPSRRARPPEIEESVRGLIDVAKHDSNVLAPRSTVVDTRTRRPRFARSDPPQ